MMTIVVSSVKSTVESGGKTEGRPLMKAEKRVRLSNKPCGTPEHGEPSLVVRLSMGNQVKSINFATRVVGWFGSYYR